MSRRMTWRLPQVHGWNDRTPEGVVCDPPQSCPRIPCSAAHWNAVTPKGEEKFLAAAFFHVYGMSRVSNLPSAWRAASHCFPRLSSREVLKTIEQEQITCISRHSGHAIGNQ